MASMKVDVDSMILPLPEGFSLTEQEQSLVDLYATVRSYEKEAARLKEKAALDRLAADNALYKSQLSSTNPDDDDGAENDLSPSARGESPTAVSLDPASATATTATSKKAKRRGKKGKRVTSVASGEGNDEEDAGAASEVEESSEEDDLVDSDEEETAENKEELERRRKRREQKLAKLRHSVELAHQSAQEKAAEEALQREKEEVLRAQHLQEDGDVVNLDSLGPALKKRAGGDIDARDKKKSSLISKLEETAATPPHDFSGKLEMGRANLSGSVLFPPPDQSTKLPSWSPSLEATSANDGAFDVELKEFDGNQAAHGFGNNTLAIKFMAPADSSRFSFNIAAPNHSDFFDVLFHFNPRQHQRGGQLVVNDKQEGIWGHAVAVPLSQIPIIFGQTSCTLVIQVNGEGFDVLLEGQHVARLEHRKGLPSKKGSLFLQFPSTDDYGSPESWRVFKVWWGHKPIMASSDLSGVAGANIYSALHPRKLFVSGLSRIHSEPEVDLRRAELERAFRTYGGAQGCTVTVPTNSTFAFVEVESSRQADLALSQMQSTYRLNRARRSRHEALQEERAAAEATKEGKVKESREWD